MIGSTNVDNYMTSLTGNRRFWSIPVGECNPAWVRDNRDQLLAEAYHYAITKDEKLYITDTKVQDQLIRDQEQRIFTGDVYDELQGILPEDGEYKVVVINLRNFLGHDATNLNAKRQRDAAMRSLGFGAAKKIKLTEDERRELRKTGHEYSSTASAYVKPARNKKPLPELPIFVLDSKRPNLSVFLTAMTSSDQKTEKPSRGSC